MINDFYKDNLRFPAPAGYPLKKFLIMVIEKHAITVKNCANYKQPMEL